MEYWCAKVSGRIYWILDSGKGAYKVRDSGGHVIPKEIGQDIARSRGARLDVLERLRRFDQGAMVEQSLYKPGEYHPRVYRPNNHPTPGKYFASQWSSSIASTRGILERMEHVLTVVEPVAANGDAFGHEIRHILILACTEVESAWKSILIANGVAPPPQGRWSTKHYVRLLKALHLDQWRTSLTRHPQYPTITPFFGWNTSSPTESLDWYAAYNHVKHDRENQLPEACLRHTVAACSAAYIMIYAQFGQFGFRGKRVIETDLFQVAAQPDYPLVQYYVPPKLKQGETWTPTNLVL